MNSNLSTFVQLWAEMIRTRTVSTRTGTKTKLTALTTLNGLVILHNLLKAEEPQRTLEVGSCYGGSALVFASMHQNLQRSLN